MDLKCHMIRSVLTSLPKRLCCRIASWGEYLLSITILSLKDSPKGTFEGTIKLIASPYGGQSNQPTGQNYIITFV